jgi:putative exporter of polyketide antibiotics
VLTLVGRTLGRVTGAAGAIAFLILSFQTSLVAIAASFEDGPGFERLSSIAPVVIQQAFGPALTSFGGLTTLGFYEPLIVLLIVQFAVYVATEPAGDVESGLVDLVLARPIARHRLMTRSLIVVTIASIAFPLIMAVSLWANLHWLAPGDVAWPEARVVLLLAMHLTAVAWCFGGAGLTAAAWSRRRGAAQAFIGIGAVALYLMDFVGDAWARVSWLAWLSPFHHFHGAQILAGATHPVRDLGVLFGLGFVGAGVGYWKFQQRDL